jgi:hypothetical protein
MGDPKDVAAPVAVDDMWSMGVQAAAADAPSQGVAAAIEQSRNNQTIAGLAVGTPAPSPVVLSAPLPASVKKPDPVAEVKVKPPEPPADAAPKLQYAERSPLDFVMNASEPGAQARPQASHDLSQFVANLVADTKPVVEGTNAGAMEPVMRSARKRRQWIALGAIAGTIAVGAAVGIYLARGGNEAASSTAASAASEPSTAASAAATPTPAPTPTAAPEPAPPPTAPAAGPETVAMAEPSVTPEPPSAEPAATPEPKVTRKASTSKPAAAKSAKRPATAKKSAKKVAVAKKSTKPAAKKAVKKPASKSKVTKKKTTRTSRS